MEIPEKLINKYNLPVTRYTSYPPANYFSNDFGEDDYIKAVDTSNHEWPENISLYIHIPFCTKQCWFCGCNAQVTHDRSKISKYIDAVKKEILMVRKLLTTDRRVSQVHWGGGTPNSLPVEIITDIMNLITGNFTFIKNPEIAIECHPALLDENYIRQLISAGFNRFSLGIQDFRQDVLTNVNRDSPGVPVEDLVAWIKSFEGTGVNLDFMYGLPFQTVKTFSDTIEKAAEISPDRLVTFSYAHVPWIKKAQKILEKSGLPDPAEKLKMFGTGYKILRENGYTPIGLDHYAKNEDELSIALRNRRLHRNFQGYCTRETTGQVYAFGATGISQLESVYAQNEKDPDRYTEIINSNSFATTKGYRVNQTEKIIRHVITEVMCNEYISFREAGNIFGLTPEEIMKAVNFEEAKFKEFVSDGLLVIENSEIFKVTEPGRFFMRNIASQFDPNLQTGEKRFSKSL